MFFPLIKITLKTKYASMKVRYLTMLIAVALSVFKSLIMCTRSGNFFNFQEGTYPKHKSAKGIMTEASNVELYGSKRTILYLFIINY